MASNKGKDICAKLKEVRQWIADANNISYTPHECHYDGLCSGTCPACEQEKRYLQTSLQRLQNQGRAIKVAGVAAGLIMSCLPLAAQEVQPQDSIMNAVKRQVYSAEDLSCGAKDVVKVSGVVVDSLNNPLAGGVIRVEGATDSGQYAITDVEGRFSVIVQRGAVLQAIFIGCSTEKIDTKEIPDLSNVKIVLKDDPNATMGEVIVVGAYAPTSADDVYIVPRSNKDSKDKKRQEPR